MFLLRTALPELIVVAPYLRPYLRGGKSLAERFFTGARCALLGFCPSAAVEGQFGLLHLHEAAWRGEGAIKCLVFDWSRASQECWMCSALSGSGIDLNVLVACKSRVLGCALKFLF